MFTCSGQNIFTQELTFFSTRDCSSIRAFYILTNQTFKAGELVAQLEKKLILTAGTILLSYTVFRLLKWNCSLIE